MKILFLAFPHADLYKEIVNEMERKGHEVIVILDRLLRYDPYHCLSKLKAVKKFVFVDTYNIYNHYWNKMIATDARLSESYDLFLALSGVSVGERLIRHLETLNPHIKKVLYTWDNCTYYAFDRMLSWFDRSYTFDVEDAKANSEWKLLPIYCKAPAHNETQPNLYDIFSIGTNHGDRLSYFYRILPQLKAKSLSYCIKVIELQTTLSWKQQLKYHILKAMGGRKHEAYLRRIEFVCDKEDKYGIKQNSYIAQNKYDELISQSCCVLDDQRDTQSGLTAKFMWALANHKKIVTTNKWAYEYEFVSSKQVLIIDKDNPIIPEDFIKDHIKENEFSDVSSYYIDRWVDELLSVVTDKRDVDKL